MWKKKTLEDIDTADLRPFVMRHHLSGVWVGFLLGAGAFPNTIEVLGRKIWSWEGHRLEPSQIARLGALPGDRLGDTCVTEIGVCPEVLVEFYTAEREEVLRSLKLPAWEG